MKQSVLLALVVFWTATVAALVWWLVQPAQPAVDVVNPSPTTITQPTTPPAAKPVTNPVVTPSPKPGGGTTLTRAELAKHNTRSSCWLLIAGNIYDVTDFLSLHPGGAGKILPSCGKDATAAFNTQGGEGQHSPTADQMLADYKLGKLTQ